MLHIFHDGQISLDQLALILTGQFAAQDNRAFWIRQDVAYLATIAVAAKDNIVA